MRFLTRKAKEDRVEARRLLLRTKIWEAIRKVVPRKLPDPSYSYLDTGNFNLRIEYHPENPEDAEKLRRKIGAVMAEKDMPISKWDRSVSEYSGDVTYRTRIVVPIPDFKGKENLRAKDLAIAIEISNGKLAPGCRIEKVEKIVPEHKTFVYKSVCDEVPANV